MALVAHNRRWPSWRNREITALPWLPQDCSDYLPAAAVGTGRTAPPIRPAPYATPPAGASNTSSPDSAYGNDPVNEAFIRAHDEPGRTWNIANWNTRHDRNYKHT